jgi:transcriptional regulator with XRE-family HTH domain
MTQTTHPHPTLSDVTRANLRSIIARRGLSRQQLADLTGKNVTWIGRRLNGTYTLTLDDVETFAMALEVDHQELVEVVE